MDNSIEQRLGAERRVYSPNTFLQSIVQPRRTYARRGQNRRYPVLDKLDQGALLLGIMLMVLSVMDSIFTLTIIAKGGTEVNPVMNYLLHISVYAFISAKMLMTAIPAILLVATANLKLFNRWRSRSILSTLVGLYAGLIVYELLILSFA